MPQHPAMGRERVPGAVRVYAGFGERGARFAKIVFSIGREGLYRDPLEGYVLMNLNLQPFMLHRNTFFCRNAPDWDTRIRREDHAALERIITEFHIGVNDTVMDVGSGTGIAIPYYRNAGVKHIYAVENSAEMVKILKRKFPSLDIIHKSFLEPINRQIAADKVIIFNTFPHFDRFDPVFRNAASYLKVGGTLVITHSLSRRELNEYHIGRGREVSEDILPPVEYFRSKLAEYGFGGITVEDSPGWFAAAGELAVKPASGV